MIGSELQHFGRSILPGQTGPNEFFLRNGVGILIMNLILVNYRYIIASPYFGYCLSYALKHND